MDSVSLTHLDGVPLPLLRAGSHDCPYLPGRKAAELVVVSPGVDAAMYQRLMNRGFRRSGLMVYRPDCPGCAECVPIRVPVARFMLSRSQRRVQRRNRDVAVEFGEPVCDDERYRLFKRYQTYQHDGRMIGSRADYERFLCETTVSSLEMTYRLDGRLVGVGIADVCPDCLSSVYFYFDPDHARRSLGVFSGLCEIEECRRRRLPFWYVGYFIAGCAKMDYKTRYRPHELLEPDGTWREHRL